MASYDGDSTAVKGKKASDNPDEGTIGTLIDAISDGVIERLAVDAKLRGDDGVHYADVFLENGVKKLQTNATATVESLFGNVVYPYTWITIDDIGDNNDTIRIQIPDDSVDVTTTKTASETTQNDLAQLIKNTLNADSNFSAYYKAVVPRDSHQVCIQAKLIQTERLDSADVIVTTTGNLEATLYYDTIDDRAIALALFPHPRDCSKGTINVTGEIGVVATGRPPKRIALEDSTNSDDQNVDGSSTPVIFKLSNNSVYDNTRDFLVTELRIEATTNAFSIGSTKYIKITSLTNGHLFQVRSDGNLEYDESLHVTDDIHHRFCFGEGSKLDVIGQSAFSLVAVFARPFYIRKSGTYTIDDDVIVTVRDDLSSIGKLRVSAVGFFEE